MESQQVYWVRIKSQVEIGSDIELALPLRWQANILSYYKHVIWVLFTVVESVNQTAIFFCLAANNI